MKFIQYYSSSRGNLYEVRHLEDRLMIECGAPWNRTVEKFDIAEGIIHGCLVTHSHQDHCKSIEKLHEIAIPVYGPRLDFMDQRVMGVPLERSFMVGPFKVMAFKTKHTPGSVGYVVIHERDSLLFVTDTRTIHGWFKIPFTHIAIECSYDQQIVRRLVDEGKLNRYYVENRLSKHMEISRTRRYLREYCDLSRCRELHLIHMSSTLGDPEKIRAEFEKEFMIKTIIKE